MTKAPPRVRACACSSVPTRQAASRHEVAEDLRAFAATRTEPGERELFADTAAHLDGVATTLDRLAQHLAAEPTRAPHS